MNIRKSMMAAIVGVSVMTVMGLGLGMPLAQTPAPATTQTPPATQPAVPEETPALTVEQVPISVQPALVTDIPLNNPVAIDLGALSVPGISPDLTRGVTVKAFTRYVEHEGALIGQLVLTGVEKNGVREPLPSGMFNAQFPLTVPRLEAGEDVVVRGDPTTLIAALEKLAATTDEPVGEKAVPEATIEQTAGGRQGQNSGGGNGNDLAGAWQAPEPVAKAAESVEGVNVTLAGCSIRVDVPQLKAIQQSRTETVKDGVVTEQSACTDSEVSFPLNKSYISCTDVIDLTPGANTAGTATAQYVLWYADSGGTRSEVSDCVADAEKMFPIVEDHNACAIFLDYTSMKAVPQATLVYQNDNNVEVQVRGCHASTASPAVAMTETTDGCTIRHDFAGTTSYRQKARVYTLNGVQYQAGGCADTDVTYAHEAVYDNAAQTRLCAPVVDMNGGTVILQSRVQITVDGVSRFITDCTPDTTSQAVTATTDGCDNPFGWQHDLAAAQSYGEERFYFTYNGTPDYVSECVRSQAVYAHQVETTGWQDHDDQRYSLALTTVYIIAPAGRYDVVVSQVLTGTVQMPYTRTGTEERETGTVTYEVCDRYTDTSKMELWSRPSGGVFEKAIGPGKRLGPTPACTTVLTKNWPKVNETHRTGSMSRNPRCYGSGKPGVNSERVGSYEGTRTRTREDGEVVVHQTVTKTIKTYHACRGNPPWGPAPAVPSRAGFAQSNTWMTGLGW